MLYDIKLFPLQLTPIHGCGQWVQEEAELIVMMRMMINIAGTEKMVKINLELNIMIVSPKMNW